MLDDYKEAIKSCSERIVFNDERIEKIIYLIFIGECFDRIRIDLIGPLRKNKRK